MHIISGSIENLWNTCTGVLKMVGSLLELLISVFFLVIFLKNIMCCFVILDYFRTK